MKNILIVDNDLGFIYWLGAALIARNYQPLPACSVSDAITVAGPGPAVRLDLMIVNPSLPGISKLITRFRRTQAHLKVVALGRQRKTALTDVNAWRRKPALSDDSAKQKWVRAINRVLGPDKTAPVTTEGCGAVN